MNQISRTHYHDKRIRNESEENQNDNWIFYIRMHQKYTSISEISRILSKIHHWFCENHHITYQSIIKKINHFNEQRNRKKHFKKSRKNSKKNQY